MHPFMNSHFNFLVTVESATSQVLLQWPRQMTVQQGKVKDYWVEGPQFTTEMTVTALMFEKLCAVPYLNGFISFELGLFFFWLVQDWVFTIYNCCMVL
jgi:hypothetical protein